MVYATAAGLCAAGASVCGKTALDHEMVHALFSSAAAPLLSRLPLQHHSVLVVLQAVTFLSVFLCNAMMVNLQSKALDLCPSVVAVITNSSANFFFSAVLGWLVFGEPLPLQWWCGAALISLGMALIHRSQADVEEKKKVE
eukprot:TRINITY_DN11279_c0_g1_i1.p2 TRINITY_DN11279_c0_g1~~TRINITY_DN11279_c0_g1_i1.p2  ORF type:complete len:141 (-),score=42.04 TRINITY_DN11279_c0_g1_i1:128-550(-)